MMSDYIKRESRTFIEIADDLNDLVTELNDKIVELIREKNVDVAPVRHGSWINCEWVESGFKFVRCSECNHADMDSRLYKYCPWCGARMDGEVIKNE